jgi:hypothetical protein
VDLHVQLRGPGGETLVLLCEVKFTEAKFSKCGGYTSPGNRDKSFCEAEFDAASVPGRCYLVAQKGRRYFQHSLAVYQSLSTGRCPFADNNQCQRNHALAKALIGAGKADEAYFGLVYHDANREILQEWDRYTALCKQEEQKRFLFTVPASELLACCEDETLRRYFADRYMVNLTTPESTVNPIETI